MSKIIKRDPMQVLSILLICFCSINVLIAEVTFTKDIAGIIFENCTECHRPNTAAPFKLMDYKDISKRAKTIEGVIQDGYMPPWHAERGYGAFKDERGLSTEQIAKFSQWIEAGKPFGDESEMPSLPEFSDGWALGEPDLIVQMPKGFTVPADGRDIYRSFVVPLDLKEDKWVKAIDIRPSARAVVHHSLFWMDDTGKARKLDGASGQAGFKDSAFKSVHSLGGWTLGAEPKKLQGEYAMPLPKGSDIVLSTHFHPSGKVEIEQTTVGIYFAEKPSPRKVIEMQVPGFYGKLSNLKIPAGESDYVLQGKMTLPMDIKILTASAHMHYLGTSAKGWATLPDGRVEPLLHIPQWDFNWQGYYHYQKPVFLPKGTIVETEIHYDNSSNNPFNPYDPPQMVKWGLESEDEMGSLIFQIVPEHERDNSSIQKVMHRTMMVSSKANANPEMELSYENVLKKFDKDKNGKLLVGEFPKQFRSFLSKSDRNKNGILEEAELIRIKPHIEKVWKQL